MVTVPIKAIFKAETVFASLIPSESSFNAPIVEGKKYLKKKKKKKKKKKTGWYWHA